MSAMSELRRRARHVVGPVLWAALAGYFGYHAVQGDRGLIAWYRVTQQLEEAKATLAEAQAERTALRKRVNLLRPDGLDPDILEERARLTLNMVRPDEVIIMIPGGADAARAANRPALIEGWAAGHGLTEAP